MTLANPYSPPDSRRRIRLLHIQLLPILSGVQRVSLEEFAGLDPNEFELHLLCQSPGAFTEQATLHGVHCHYAAQLQRAINPHRDLAAYRQIEATIRRIKPDIVHTHSSKTGLLGRLAAYRCGVPAIVHTVHGFAFPAVESAAKRKFYQLCERLAGRRCDAVICLNRSDEQTARELLGIPHDHVIRIPNGIVLDRFEPAIEDVERTRRKRDLLGLDDRPLVINVGRLWQQKNPEAFVRAACHLIREGLHCQFALVGDGPLRERLAGIIDQAGVSDSIHLLGWRSDVPQLLPLADAFVLSSSWEGMPLVLLEANACGVPAIATDIPGSRDCIVDGETGLLARPHDLDDLAEKIRFLISHSDLRKTMSARCRQHVRDHHDIRNRHAEIKRLYSALLRRGGRGELAALIAEPSTEASRPASVP